MACQNGGKADHNGLYIHWVGGNDLAAAIAQPTMAQQIAGNSATSAAAQVGLLLDAGAGLVVVPNVPDISATPMLLEAVITAGLGAAAPPALKAALDALAEGATPDFASRQQAIRKALLAAAATVSSNPFIQQLLVEQLLAGYEAAAGQASALTDYYNQMEEKGLEQHGGNIARADINGLFKEILANPQAFGLTNTVGMACPLAYPLRRAPRQCTDLMRRRTICLPIIYIPVRRSIPLLRNIFSRSLPRRYRRHT